MKVLAYGGGVNSTALLVGMTNAGEKVDLITFADTGGERPNTYAYVEMFSKWLVDHGQPQIITVKKVKRDGSIFSLEQDCLDGKILPSIAYGFKACSMKYKAQPQDKYRNNHAGCKKVWKAGGKVDLLIGFDAGEAHRIKDFDDPKYNTKYPLVDWDWGRDECIKAIQAAGLCSPGKSSCFYCPSMKAHEIKLLNAQYPELAQRALAMEANAECHTIKGLGRNWAWKDLLATDDMFEDEFIQPIDQACGCYDG